MRRSTRKAPAGLAARTDAELGTVLATVSSFQGAIQHADDKARTVAAVLAMITAMTTAQLGSLNAAHPLAVPRSAVAAVLLCFAAAYVFSSVHLVKAIWPRTSGPGRDNRFAFPSVAAGLGPRSVRDHRAQAGELAALLAKLAMRKHRHVRAALAGTCVLLASGPGVLLLAALG